MTTMRFAYDPEVVARFPSVAGGVIHAVGVTNGPSSAALTDAFRAEQERVRARIGDAPLSEIPTLAAWRRAMAILAAEPNAARRMR